MTYKTLELINALLVKELDSAREELEAIRHEYRYAPEETTMEELKRIRERKSAAASRVCRAENALDEFLSYDQW